MFTDHFSCSCWISCSCWTLMEMYFFFSSSCLRVTYNKWIVIRLFSPLSVSLSQCLSSALFLCLGLVSLCFFISLTPSLSRFRSSPESMSGFLTLFFSLFPPPTFSDFHHSHVHQHEHSSLVVKLSIWNLFIYVIFLCLYHSLGFYFSLLSPSLFLSLFHSPPRINISILRTLRYSKWEQLSSHEFVCNTFSLVRNVCLCEW